MDRMKNSKPLLTLAFPILCVVTTLAVFAADDAKSPKSAASATAPDRSDIDGIIAGWPERPKLGAHQMLAKYGAPQEITAERLIWHDKGPFKRITVTKAEHHHDFPLPHMDYMEHTIEYRVPGAKADELTKFDGSATFDKTQGELSARCDLEGHNILTLNIAHEVLSGKKSAEEARKAFGVNVADDMAGKYPPYTVSLQFEPETPGADPDKPSMPGAPKRAAVAKSIKGKDADKGGKTGDPEAKNEGSAEAEILSLLLAIDTNVVVAAMEAVKKKLSEPLAAYAKMLHMEHGKSAAATMALGLKLDITPIDSDKTDELRRKGAGALATLVPLSDDAFGPAYIAAMKKGHTEVLTMIEEFISTAQSESLKNHLKETRSKVAMHLEEATKLDAR